MLADTFSQVTSLVRGVIWPIVVVIVLVVYRHEISNFIAGLGGRISRVSFGGASVEFTLASEVSSATVSAVTDFIDATSAAGHIASDAGSSLQTAIYSTGADFVKIDLRGGHGWLTSRLYIFSIILSEASEVKKLVFVQRSAAGIETFAGMADPLVVADRLGSKFRWLSYALTEATLTVTNAPLSGLLELARFKDPQWASGVAERYLVHPLIRHVPFAGMDNPTPKEFKYNEDPPVANNPHVSLSAPNSLLPSHQLPNIGEVTPLVGPRTGGTPVTITGQGFSGLKYVRFGESLAAISSVTDEKIETVSPPGVGDVRITVVTSAGSSTITDDWVTIRSSGGSLHAEHAAWISNEQHLLSLVGDAIDKTRITETSATKRSDLR